MKTKAWVAIIIVTAIVLCGYVIEQIIHVNQTNTYTNHQEPQIQPHMIEGEPDNGFGPRQYIRVRDR